MTDKKTTRQEDNKTRTGQGHVELEQIIRSDNKDNKNLTLTGREGLAGMSMTHCSTFCGECCHRKVKE